jgi:rare lipoprotein A
MKLLFSTLLLLVCISGVTGQAGYEETGVASYYSDIFDGRKTASGEVYSKDDLTCAHKTLPYGTLLRVTSLKNSNSVVVKVNDRGPYSHGRIVDLSRAAAEAIGLVKAGKMDVKIQQIDMSELPLAKTYPLGTNTTEMAPEVVVASQSSAQTEPMRPPAAKAPPELVRISDQIAAPINSEGRGELITAATFKKNATYRIELSEPSPEHGFVVQIASLTKLEDALKEIARIQQQAPHQVLMITDTNKSGDQIFKLAVGPFEEKAAATKMKDKLARKGFPKCFVTKD